MSPAHTPPTVLPWPTRAARPATHLTASPRQTFALPRRATGEVGTGDGGLRRCWSGSADGPRSAPSARSAHGGCRGHPTEFGPLGGGGPRRLLSSLNRLLEAACTPRGANSRIVATQHLSARHPGACSAALLMWEVMTPPSCVVDGGGGGGAPRSTRGPDSCGALLTKRHGRRPGAARAARHHRRTWCRLQSRGRRRLRLSSTATLRAESRT